MLYQDYCLFTQMRFQFASIDGPMISIMPKHADLKVPLVFQASELKKYFKMGDHVKVLAGKSRFLITKKYSSQLFIA